MQQGTSPSRAESPNPTVGAGESKNVKLDGRIAALRVAGPWLFCAALVAAVTILAVQAFRLEQGGELGIGPGRWPRIVMICLILLTVTYVFQFAWTTLRSARSPEMRRGSKDSPEKKQAEGTNVQADSEHVPSEATAAEHSITTAGLLRLVALIALLFAYAYTFTELSFIISTAIMLFTAMVIMGRRLSRAVIDTAVLVSVFYLTFGLGLNVPLPSMGFGIF